MKKIKYIYMRLKEMNFKNLFSTIKRIHKKAKKTYCFIVFDIIYCGIKYLAGYVDYEQLEFYNLTKAQRKTIITRGINNNFVKLLNNKDYFKYLDDKILFNEKYNEFILRDWIDLRKCTLNDFSDFLKLHKEIIAKPINLCCGQGVEKIIYTKDMNVGNIFNKLKNNNQFLIEEYVKQHTMLNRLYPESVNTLRIVTILKNGQVYVPFICLRIGNCGNVVDNFNHGGLLAIVNENGVITSPAIDKDGNTFLSHPYTNTPIINYQIPLFEQAIELAKKMAFITPEIAYTGWDISITEKGAVVIEGNAFPGHDVYQSMLTLKENNIGLLPKFNEIVYEKKM